MSFYLAGLPIYFWMLHAGLLLVLVLCLPWRRMGQKLQAMPRNWNGMTGWGRKTAQRSLKLLPQVALFAAAFALALGFVLRNAASLWGSAPFVITGMLTLLIYFGANMAWGAVNRLRRRGWEPFRFPWRKLNFSLWHALALVAIAGLSLGITRGLHPGAPVPLLLPNAALIALPIIVFAVLATLGIDTLRFGRGSGRRANRLRELEAQHKDVLREEERDVSPWRGG